METDPRFDPFKPAEDEPPFRNLYVLSMKVYMALVCLAALSFMFERLIVFMLPQLVVIPLPVAIFLVLMIVSVFFVNHHHSKFIHDMAKKDLHSWWRFHRMYPLKSLTADMIAALLGIAPSVILCVYFFGANIIPHLLCLLIAMNIVAVTPKRKRQDPKDERFDDFS